MKTKIQNLVKKNAANIQTAVILAERDGVEETVLEGFALNAWDV